MKETITLEIVTASDMIRQVVAEFDVQKINVKKTGTHFFISYQIMRDYS